MSQSYSLPPELLARIRARSAFTQKSIFGQQLIGYWTKGGTYVVASAGYATDSGDPRDLVAILPGDLGQGRVLPLYLGTNPAIVTYLARYLDCITEAEAVGWSGPAPLGDLHTCSHSGCDHPASRWAERSAVCACDHPAEAAQYHLVRLSARGVTHAVYTLETDLTLCGRSVRPGEGWPTENGRPSCSRCAANLQSSISGGPLVAGAA